MMFFIHSAELEAAAQRLAEAVQTNISFKLNAGKRVGNFNLAKYRHATNASDRLLMELFDVPDIVEEIERMYAQMFKTDFEEESGSEGLPLAAKKGD